jgi:hypothetical protein
MKKLLFIFFALVFLSSCSKEEKKITETTKKDTVTQKTTTADTQKQTTTTPEQIPEGLKGVSYGIKDIPKSISVKGNVVSATKWTDKNGENYLVFTETEKRQNPNNPEEEELISDKEFFGYQYIIKEGNAKQLWKIQDFVKGCDADLTLELIDKSVAVTDLNNDGIAETSFMYRLGCRSDVSPCGLKLLMHEGETKYALRGETMVFPWPDSPNKGDGGKITDEKSFANAPKGFLEFAKKQWEKFKEERFE